MRILVVSSSWPTPHAPYNGVFVRDHCQMMAAAGHEVHVVAPRVFREGALCDNEQGIDVERFRYPSGQRLLAEYAKVPRTRMVVYVASGVMSTRRAIRRFQPDIVIAHWLVPTGLVASMAVLHEDVPLITIVHGGDVARSGAGLVRMAAGRAVRGADELVCVSEVLRQRVVEDLGAGAAHTHVAPMGVDLTLFRPSDRDGARRSLGVPLDADVIGFVGNISREKGVLDLLDALSGVLIRRPNVVLMLAGKGPLSDSIGELAASRGLPEGRVVVLGPVAHENLPEFLAAIDVLTLPSYAEGLPVSLMEGAAVGVPIVATDVGAVRGIIEADPNSVLIAPNDIDGLQAGLVSVLEAERAPRFSRIAEASTMDRRTHMDYVLSLARSLTSDDRN